ncbi:MAG: carboxypeptidase-like regulatory domain-containing protein, partial [Gammaproteobacteria bacterium]
RGAWNPQTTVLLPRAGIAIRLNDRTALRIGYARYAVASDSSTDIVDVLGSTPYPGFDQTTNPLPILEGKPQAFLADPYPAGRNPLIPPVGKSLGRYTALGSDAVFFEQNWRNETNDRLNVSFQRQTVSQIVLDVTYFANFGHNAPQDLNLNLLDPRLSYQHRTLLNPSVDNPFYRILTPQKFPGQLRNAQRVSVGSLLVPYPQYGSLTMRGVPMRNTRYHALQISAQRPFANGFNLLFGLNYNRGRAEEFYDGVDHIDRRLNYQTTNNILPRRKVTGAAIYQFPFGRGRRFMRQANPVIEGVMGGWTASGIFEYYSGVFLRFGGYEVTGDPRLDNPSRQARFNTSAFRTLPAFTRRANPIWYEGVTGPSFRNIDMTLSKDFRVTERIGFELRLEAYN